MFCFLGLHRWSGWYRLRKYTKWWGNKRHPRETMRWEERYCQSCGCRQQRKAS